MEASILSRFIQCSTRLADHRAIHVDDRSYSYGEFAGLCAAVAALLDRHGVQRGDRVGILAENSVYTYASLLGILSVGACYVPLSPHNPMERNHAIITDAGIGLLLHTEHEDETRALAGTGTPCRALSNRVTASTHAFTAVDQAPDDPCYLLFTSGTTGKPKGVPIYHRNLSAFLRMMLESGRYEFSRHDRFLQMFQLTFDLSVFSFLVPLSVGASLYPIPRRDMGYLEVADVLATHEITVALMVPSVINFLKPYFGEMQLPHVRYSLFCGEALYHDILRDWAACVPHAKIENLYGPTEATVFCLRYEWRRGEPPHPHGKGIVPIGTPMEGMDAFIEHHGAGEAEGELCLRGDQVTRGYWNNAARTTEAFGTTGRGDRFYRTGDLCKVDASGDFLYLGRIDNQVKIDGHRVELEEIEFHARAVCGDKQVVAAVRRSDVGSLAILLFIESETGAPDGMREYLRRRLPDYMMPREIITVSPFPLNSNGKIDRKALLHRWLEEPKATPASPTRRSA
jgi:D-alanine--poly(phosphoribitol) ligase subunit 1